MKRSSVLKSLLVGIAVTLACLTSGSTSPVNLACPELLEPPLASIRPFGNNISAGYIESNSVCTAPPLPTNKQASQGRLLVPNGSLQLGIITRALGLLWYR